jgi:hypothetical protein
LQESTVVMSFKLAQVNWERNSKAKVPHFQKLKLNETAMLGHANGMDIVALSPSDKKPSEWSAVTAAFDMKIGPLPRFSTEWDNTLMIRFDSDHRQRLAPFVLELLTASSGDVDRVFDETMADWKAFFERWGAPLSLEEQRGLLGELLVLERLIGAGDVS